VARNKVPELALGPIAAALGRMLLASAVMGEAVWWMARQVGGNVGLDAVVRVLAGSVTGVVVYVVILAALRAPELDALLRRRRS
jgi:putative peptidoglycan lipid II flippase